ncbi:sensor histidine kinase [Pseudonocardia xishanensis]|uniref:histidine kinase n=1 Tax=Pseudonocardia xishanensis TaxID=630995 RepID=A0ABP8RK70_9PSEU
MTSTERDPAWSERLNPRNWSLAAKLVAVGLVPTLLALVLGVLRISDQAGVAARLGEDNRLLDIRQGVTTTSQALQAERNAAVLFVAGGRQGDRGPLDQAVAASDGALDAVRTGLADPTLLDASGTTALQNAEGGFTQLSVLRSEVGNSLVPTDAVNQRYTAIIQRAGVLERALVRQAASADTAGLGDAVTATSEAREALALQHTTIAGAIVSRELREADRITVTGTDAAFTSAFADYQVALTPEQLGRYGNFATNGANVERERMRTEIMATPPGRPVVADPAAWDAAYASSVAVVDRSAAGVGEELTASSVAAQESASNQAGVNSVVLMLGVLLGIAIIVLLARTLIRSLRILRRSALDVAERKLPAAVESMRSGQPLNAMVEPVPLTGRDEVGQVARAFDAVHGQAIRLAADQAALQANVSNMFVNLSRRSQALVERQLQLIEQLESNEQDPDQLSNLFQLDHLATRMRRNSENLLVLAGTDLAKRNVAPVPVVDVLRAAVSEIEQYQRVVVQPPPVATVAGRAASDLVHLIAELLDNATNFSPPDSQVVMATTRANDGSLIVEIADRGVGMADHELSEANQRLGQPAAVDVSASRRMGLFVVGRLANRHGLGIRLGGGSAGGTGGGLTATVTVPSVLVPSAEPVDRRPARAGAVPASAYSGAPAAPAASPSLPAQRPGSNGRSLSSLVAGDDGPMSPAPAFGGGRPPAAPPLNGNGLPQRRPGPVPSEDEPEARPAVDGSEATAGDVPRPAGPERGPWPVESLRRPPNGGVVPTRQTNGFTPGEAGPLPKRTPRGVDGSAPSETGTSGNTTSGTFGAAAGAAGLIGAAGASALRRSTDGPTTPETTEPGDSRSGADQAPAAAEGGARDRARNADDRTDTHGPAGLPVRSPSRGGRGVAPQAPTGPETTETSKTDAPADASVGTEADTPATGSAVDGTAVDGTAVDGTAVDGTAVDGTAADGTAAESTALESTAVDGGAPASGAADDLRSRTTQDTSAADAEDEGEGDAPARPAADRSAPRPMFPSGLPRRTPTVNGARSAASSPPRRTPDTAAPEQGGSPTRSPADLPVAAETETGEPTTALPVVNGTAPEQETVGGSPTDESSAAGENPAGAPRTEGVAAQDIAATESTTSPVGTSADSSSGADRGRDEQSSTGRVEAGALGALGGVALGAAALGADGRGTGTESDASRSDSGDGRQEGLPQRRPLPSRAADQTVASRPPEQVGGLPRRAPDTPAADLPHRGPVAREAPPTGPAGLPQRTPRRPKQAETTGTETLFAASTPGDSQTTGQLRRPGGFASRRPTRGGAPTAPGALGSTDHTASGDADVSAEAFGTGAPAEPGAGTNGAGLSAGQDVGRPTDRSAARATGPQGPNGTGSTGGLQGLAGLAAQPANGQAPNGLPRREPAEGLPTRDPQGATGLPPKDPQGFAGSPTRDPRGLPGRDAQGPHGLPTRNPQGSRGLPRDPQGPDGLPGRDPQGSAGLPTRNPQRATGEAPSGEPQAPNGLPGREPQGRPGLPGREPQGPPRADRSRPGLGGPGGLSSRTPGADRGAVPAPAGRPETARPEPQEAQGPRDDAGLPGSSGAAPEPSRGPSGFDLGQTTPIFEEIASAWFRSNGDVPVRWAEGGDGGEGGAEPADRQVAEPVFATAADEGWRVADATAQATAAESDAQGETTDAGLPKRRPRARLVPGSAAGSAVLAPPSGPARNAEAIRGRLASYQQGVRQGRESRLRRQSSPVPGANEQQNEENR